MIKLLINGASGRMGHKVLEAIENDKEIKAICGVALENDFSNTNFPIYKNFDDIKEYPDVIIDFSSAKCLPNIINFCIKRKIGAVLCSTGYSKEDIKMVEKASKEVPLFRSANMSLGVNFLIEAVKLAAKKLKNFDIEIIEKHHNQKVDSPSGTALMFADAIKEIFPDDYNVCGREGICGKRNKKEIGIHSIRGGNIVGDHDILFAGENETVILSHHAQDRSVFATGAVSAAKFLVAKKCGLYSMKDLIGSLEE